MGLFFYPIVTRPAQSKETTQKIRNDKTLNHIYQLKVETKLLIKIKES